MAGTMIGAAYAGLGGRDDVRSRGFTYFSLGRG